ncbi:MAG: hypothetical protein ACLPOO_09160 [Terriglobales bacterium]
MSPSSKSRLLDDQLGLLVRHFGVRRVRSAVEKLSADGDEGANVIGRLPSARKPTQPTVLQALELTRGGDPEKHRLLSEFLVRLKDRTVLPESQDIRHFAQLIGLKDVRGKSRKDMVPALMRFMLERATEKLRIDIKRADNISELQRREGYSVLTDKLVGQR